MVFILRENLKLSLQRGIYSTEWARRIEVFAKWASFHNSFSAGNLSPLLKLESVLGVNGPQLNLISLSEVDDLDWAT